MRVKIIKNLLLSLFMLHLTTEVPSMGAILNDNGLVALRDEALLLNLLGSSARTIEINHKIIPISLLRTNENALIFTINTPTGEGECFEFKISGRTIDGKRFAGKISALYPDAIETTKNCKQFYGLGGNDYISLADSIATVFDLKQVNLMDVSRISCRSGSKAGQIAELLESQTHTLDIDALRKQQLELFYGEASLKTARMFTRGNTWYGSRGFYPEEIDPELFKTLMESLRNISFSRYWNCLVNRGDTTYLDTDWFYYFSLYNKHYPEDQLVLLKDFMSWLFREHCPVFDSINDQLRYTAACDDLDIGKGIRLFQDSSIFSTKYYEGHFEVGSTQSKIGIEILKYIHQVPFRGF